MQKAERLFQLINLLQNRRRVVTAENLAQTLNVSVRTIYRDIQTLSLSGIPIEGDAGQGYRLMKGFDIPPLMFSDDELEALVTGARMVQAWTSQQMATSAVQAMQKISAVLPERLQHILDNKHIMIPDFHIETESAQHLDAIRDAIKNKQILELDYQRADSTRSKRSIKPLGLFYWGAVWTLIAWCQLRNDFRNFRVDRIEKLKNTQQTYTSRPGEAIDDYLNGICHYDNQEN